MFQRSYYFLLTFAIVLGVFARGLHVSAVAAPPPAGTLISSQARLNYIDPQEYVGKDVLSNTVRVAVTGSPTISLQDNQTITRPAGTPFIFAHTLTNYGNVAGNFTIEPSLRPGSPITLANMAVVIDSNGNGVIDSGEPTLPFGSFDVTLNAGESLSFILTATIPAILPVGVDPVESMVFDIVATLNSTGETVANVDTLNIQTGAPGGAGTLNLFKSVSPISGSAGDTVVYSISGTNTSLETLGPRNISVDGSQVSRFIVRDSIPANIEFVEFVQNNNATPLYRLAGANTHSYQTTPPADLSQVSAIAWAFDDLPSNFSFEVSFRARVGPLARGQIPNTAVAHFRRNGSNDSISSNTSILTIPGPAPTIDYYNNINFEKVIPATRLGSELFLQVEAGECNLSSDTVEEVTVVITSATTGDQESFTATETGPNTGVFRILPAVPTQDAGQFAPVAGDGVLQTVANDELIAEVVGCAGSTIRTRILIDPAGVVYDSRTNEPLAGATVTLIDVSGSGNGGNPGGPAVVYDFDGVQISATMVTGADGEFQFPLVSASTYRLSVTPPADYSFPSVIPLGAQPSGRRINQPGSFGGEFPVNLATGAVFLDVPLDTTSGSGLALEKEASRSTAEIGDSVVFTLKLTNDSGAPFNYTFIDDRLPPGFRYEHGTAHRDGVRISDPQGSPGPSLRFPVGSLPDGESTTFTYRVRLTPGAEKGNGINRAQATSFGPPVLVSNLATAQVRPTAGIFDPRGIIIGTVFVDANGNGIQDPGEPGVPGVRLILEDGTYAITDSQGMYSIYGQRAITHVLKVDPHTLPAGAKLGGSSPRFALDPGSRFVDMKRHELHKANFMLVEPTEELYEIIEERKKLAESWTPEILSALQHSFTADGVRQPVADVRGREASGIVGTTRTRGGSFESVLPPNTLTPGNSSLPPSPVATVPMVELENLVRSITEVELGFIGLRDGDTLPQSQASVRIVGELESSIELYLNGELAPASRIGKVVEQADPALRAVEYVALRFQPGENYLEAVQYDLFGNERVRKGITVIAPDSMAKLELSFSTTSPMADGRTPVEVVVRAVDRNGVPVTASMPITLESSLGRWDVVDANMVEPGVQVLLENGYGTYHLLPPIEPGDSRIVVSSGTLKAEQRISFLPELRPMVATGIIEGRLSLNRLSRNDILPLSPDDAFEETLRSLSGDTSGRAAFYLKGKISGDTLLTVAYDSDKRKDVELFRDIDPDAFYPVYGDDSIKGYDAQSTGNLYVRLDRGRSYALLGDFNTRDNNEARQLGEYNRSFNGVRLHHETSRMSGGVWLTDDSTRQVVSEIPANGTSGPFNFSAGDGLLNSETVEIITRDRNQPSIIISTRVLSRNSDYDFEPFSGRLLLRRPVSSVDSDFNPQFIRITYEVDDGGDRFLTYGGNLQFKLNERIELGGSFAREEHPFEPFDLQSINTTIKVADGTYLILEGARTDTFDMGEGHAGRVDLRHQSGGTEARIFYGVTEEEFNNQSSQLNAGRIEGGAKVTHQLAPRTQLLVEGVYTEDKVSSGNRRGVQVDVAHTLDNDVRLTVGGRVSEETEISADPTAPNDTPLSVRSLRVRADTPVPGRPHATVFAEYEQDVVRTNQKMVAAGGHYQLDTKTRLYARHEFISSLGGPFELDSTNQNNTTVVGLESEYMRDGSVTNEYRVRNGIDGQQAEAATGLRNLWTVSEGFRLNTTFERVTPFGTINNTRSTAATVGFEYTEPVDWKVTGRLEGRWSDTSDNYLSTLGYARRLNEEWTFLGRSIVNTQLAKGVDGVDLYQGRLLTGLAWRQKEEDVWNGLFRYEYKYEQGSPTLGDVDLRRHVHIFATSLNYQPDAAWIFSGHYATKFVSESGAGFSDASYMAHLLAGRCIFEINERWDAGLNVAASFSNRADNVQYAIGPEIGRVFAKNVRIGVGYNLVGFSDRDFDTAATAQGVFLSLRIKFDENLLNWAKFE